MDPQTSLHSRASSTILTLKGLVPHDLAQPKVAIVCGSGLGGLARTVEEKSKVEVQYSEVPGFPVSTVQGHDGKLVFGYLGPKRTPVVLLVGRAHYYEGHSMEVVTYATRVCKLLGVQVMIVTNAAGGLNPGYNVGDIVLLNDHINLAGLIGQNPLRGPNEAEFGIRFPPLSDAYDLSLRRLAHRCWKDLAAANPSSSSTSHSSPSVGGMRLHEGIYAFAAGPTYETRSECRALRLLGGDVVGMSTVPEIIVARHCGIRILAFSLVTNRSVLDPPMRGDDPSIQGLNEEELIAVLSKGGANHEEVLEAGKKAAGVMEGLVGRIVETLM